jgi:hypothetical protein
MTTLYEDTNPRSLKELLADVHAGTAVLPDFQRNFVWEPGAVVELILSIANGFPAGSLLRIRNSREYFAWRPFEGAVAPQGKPTFLILDGQQRLTSLYQAFYGIGTHRFFIDLNKVMAGEDLEEALFHCRSDRLPATELLPKNSKSEEHARARAAQARRMVLPLAELKGSIDSFNTWKSSVVTLLSQEADGTPAPAKFQEALQLMSRLDAVAKQWIGPIDDYQFPVVTLSDQTSAEAVCTIFETLNRTGVKLTAFELLTARFFASGLNLRTLWQASLDAHPIIEEFDIDPYAILQAITLQVYRPVTMKRSALMELTREKVEARWETTAAALASGLTFLREDCGVVNPKWLPYGTMIPPLAALLADQPLVGGVAAGARRAKLARWFWCASLGQVYEAAAGTKAQLDYEEIKAWFAGGKAPQSVQAFTFNPDQLVHITPRQRALYRTLMCLTLSGGAKDFHSHQRMTAALIRENQVDDHHLFPLDFLGEKDRRAPNSRFDNILNRTLIDAETNRRIGANSPEKYLKVIEAAQDVALIDQVLDSHGINADARAALRNADYDAFIAARKESFFDRISDAVGFSEFV